MKAIITNDILEIEGLQLISGNINTYELEMETNWKDVTIEALFIQEESAISVPIMNGKVNIPNLTAGKWCIGFIGYKIENEIKVKQISTNLQPFLTIIGAGDDSIVVENQEVPEASVWEQYISIMNGILENAIEVRTDVYSKHDEFNTSFEEKKEIMDNTCTEMNSMKESVENTKLEIDTKAEEVENARQEVSDNAEIVEADKEQVSQDKTSVNSTYADFLSQLGSEVATLENGKVPIAQIPRIAITETKTFATVEERDLWESEEGDIAIVTSNNKSYIKDDKGEWQWLESPSDYSTNSGHSATSDFASDSEKINGKRVIAMTQESYDNAFDNGTLLEDTFYFVPKED